MKTDWDYTALADAYVKRPDYAASAIEACLQFARTKAGDEACDVGAGAGHLTLMLAERGLQVVAVEPNDAMRAQGERRTQDLSNVRWAIGTGEATGQPDLAFGLVTFGSSFNVTERSKALHETARILKPGGTFACLWNHRDLEDPIQSEIERLILSAVPDYDYGSRREDQTEVIAESGLFEPAVYIEGKVTHTQSLSDCIEAWRSHGTLQRQAGSKFTALVDTIAAYLESLSLGKIQIPYVTRLWAAHLR